MSFFGFDASQNPRDRGHPSTAPGFSQAQDPFSGLSRGNAPEDNDGDAIDFDDTYDGLGDQLVETGDDFNDDTFGGGSSEGQKAPGKDFDFFGRTAQVSNAITEEQMIYSRQQAPQQSIARAAEAPNRTLTKPARSGYEKYNFNDHVSDLQVDPNLWGTAPQGRPSQQQQQQLQHQQQQQYHQMQQHHQQQSQQQPQQQQPFTQRKMLSLEEVEEQLRQSRKAAQQAAQGAQGAPQGAPQPQFQQEPRVQPGRGPAQNLQQGGPVPEQRQQRQQQQHPDSHPVQAELPARQAPGRPGELPAGSNQRNQGPPIEPGQVNQGRQIPPQAGFQQQQQRGPIPGTGYGAQGQIITHPQQIMQLSEEERAAFLVEDAKRAKRNHKIFLLSKDNGLMTPQDKNFITRIQLQQLMTATGNVNEQDPDAALAEDFYYQVHNQIRGGPRANPHQPLNHFAQTYLFQTGGRHSGFSRRQARTGENHMQRMEQQVQRAVEAAKLKPKNKQLVIEGSLGKISFSNAKTPKPLLNIKRHDSSDLGRPQSGRQNANKDLSTSDRKSILKDIENVYTTLMMMEDEQRKEPLLPPQGEPSPAEVQAHMEWGQHMSGLNQKLWTQLKVLEPINPGSPIPHPFIAILSYPKGKKMVPRVFRHLTNEQHVTVLTMIVLHLDILDVVRLGHLQPGESQLPTAAREAIDLFSAVVTPSLFAYVSEAPLFNIIGLLGLILDRVNVQNISRTRVGLSILTMLTSRAILVKDEGGVEEGELQQWAQSYDRLFDGLEPVLGSIFPGSVNSGEDMYVWQFLAAMGSGASPEQQQRLVIAVKDRVMETVSSSRTLPPDMASQRLGNVNLFMRAIGLDVELLG